ncbi:MAG: hypothetical protein ABSF99_00800 [Anaerolineales bacterium]
MLLRLMLLKQMAIPASQPSDPANLPRTTSMITQFIKACDWFYFREPLKPV